MKQVLGSRAECLGGHPGLAAHCLGAGLAKGKDSGLVATASLAKGINSCSALVTQGRMAAQARLIVSRNYGDIVPPKITCKG